MTELDCKRCGEPIKPGQKRLPADSGAMHEHCPDREPTKHLRVANQSLALSISNQYELSDSELWWHLEDARTAIRNAQSELDEHYEPGYCRACGTDQELGSGVHS